MQFQVAIAGEIDAERGGIHLIVEGNLELVADIHIVVVDAGAGARTVHIAAVETSQNEIAIVVARCRPVGRAERGRRQNAGGTRQRVHLGEGVRAVSVEVQGVKDVVIRRASTIGVVDGGGERFAVPRKASR